jgi:Skp family chaperone for outer membrane proteins
LIVKTCYQAIAVLGLFVASAATVHAQQTSEPLIAVLDVAKVFKSDATFTQRIDDIQKRAQQLKADVEAQQNELRRKAQQASETFKPNSPERQDAEAKLEQDMTGLRTFARQSETELMTEEAKVYYDTYLKMQGIVEATAKANNIALVLRFDSSEIIPTDRGSVVAGVNRAVVFQAQRDITDFVIGEMNPTKAADAKTTKTK